MEVMEKRVVVNIKTSQHEKHGKTKREQIEKSKAKANANAKLDTMRDEAMKREYMTREEREKRRRDEKGEKRREERDPEMQQRI